MSIIRPLNVFLSSTGADLEAYRLAVIAHMRPLDGFRCVYMEDFGARDGSAIHVCHSKVQAADVLVGLTGHYRGWEPPGDNGLRSITEMEYDWAGADGKSRLMYVLPDGIAGPPAQPADLSARQAAFRERVLAENTVDARLLKGELRTPEALAAAVMTALANITYRQALLAMQEREQSALAVPRSRARAAKSGMFDWLLGRKRAARVAAGVADRAPPAPASPPAPAGPGPATADVSGALTAFAHDPAYAALLDPATFDMAKLEAAVAARSQQRLASAADERRAAAADYKRLAELTGFYDIEKALGHYGRAYAADPTDGSALYQYADLCLSMGRSAEAFAAFARFDPAAGAAADTRGAFWAQIGYGNLCAETGDLPRARSAFEGAREVAQKEAAADPGSRDGQGSALTRDWQRDLSVSHTKIGDVLVAQGSLPAALDSFKAGLAIAAKLAAADPGNAGWQRDLSVSHNKIGDVLVAQGSLPAALDSFKAGLAIRAKLAAADPGNAGWQRDLSVSHERLGEVFERLGQMDQAVVHFLADLVIAERLAKADPTHAGWQRDAEISRARMRRLGTR